MKIIIICGFLRHIYYENTEWTNIEKYMTDTIALNDAISPNIPPYLNESIEIFKKTFVESLIKATVYETNSQWDCWMFAIVSCV